ncbi:lipase family protein, partial [Crossiella equi]|uniref:lipase family protein n=1 Tax=Crossiella equi TaxID=130796 RepID=UPI0020136DE7
MSATSCSVPVRILYEVALIGQFLLAGFGLVITDYQGLGVAGPHTYAVGPVAGYAMLDAARA